MSSDYTQDVEFASNFDALQAPIQIFSAAAVTGFDAKRVDRPFRYLDLACGNGLTLNTIADCYPHAEFVGIDINSDHISRAIKQAERGGLANVSYHVGDVLSLDASEFDPFDYIAVSGVYSWLDASRREALRKFCSAVTGDEGLVYIDYSSQPGVAQTAPLYRLLQQIGAGLQGSSGDRLAKAARAADRIRKAGAAFFAANPMASQRLDSILANPPESEAHEVFNLQEGGLWSGDVITDMSHVELNFAGTAGLHLNLPKLSGAPNFSELPIAVGQSCLDAFWNVHQRRDIYSKGNFSLDPDASIATLADLPVYVQPGSLEPQNIQKVAQRFKNYDFGSPAAKQLVGSVKDSVTFADLFEKLEESGVSQVEARDVVRHFVASRIISIAVATTTSGTGDGAFKLASRLNHQTLVEDIGNEFVRPFSSPVAGSRVLLPIKERLYIWALLGLDLNEAWDRLGDSQGMFRDPQNYVIDRTGFAKIIEESLPSFKTRVAPELERLGILSRGK